MNFYLKRVCLGLVLLGLVALASCTGPAEPPVGPAKNRASGKTVGVYKQGEAKFYLRASNATGNADISFAYGPTGQKLVPLAGDWDGNGNDSVGLYDPKTGAWYLKNANEGG